MEGNAKLIRSANQATAYMDIVKDKPKANLAQHMKIVMHN